MKLYAYVINGQVVGVNLTSWLVGDLLGNPPFKVGTIVPVGYTEITSAENWDLYGENCLDYIFVRYWIQTLLIPIANPSYPTINFSGWNNLTASQKEIMARYVLAPYSLRTTIFSDAQDKVFWVSLLDKTQGTGGQIFTGRALIIENMRKYVANRVRIETMSMATTQVFYKDVKSMLDDYVAAAAPDFKLWLTNEIGSAYELAGLAQKSYYTIQLRDELMNIYNGLV